MVRARLDFLRQQVYPLVEFTDGAHDALGGGLDLSGQLLDRIGDHTEAATGLAGMSGFHRRIERDQAGLERNLGDPTRAFRYLPQCLDDSLTSRPTASTASRACATAARLLRECSPMLSWAV